MPSFVVESKFQVGEVLWFYDKFAYKDRFVQGEIIDIKVNEGKLVYIVKQIHEQELYEGDLYYRNPWEGRE